MDQEKETKRQAERCRALAQRIVRELTPASIQVLGGSGALAESTGKGRRTAAAGECRAGHRCSAGGGGPGMGGSARTAVCTGAAGMHRCIGHG
ncbi:MAG: hypothetical protein ACLUW8_04505 [Subdoligranulum sp.]